MPKETTDNSQKRQEAHALLDRLIDRVESENLCGRLGVFFDAKSPNIASVREVIDATVRPTN